jgi:hypothetical protein
MLAATNTNSQSRLEIMMYFCEESARNSELPEVEVQ